MRSGAFFFLVWASAASLTADDGTAFFESKVRPLLLEHCHECHSGEKTKGGLALDTKAGWEKGGDSGVVIVPGKPEESLLIKAVRYHDKDLAMPPEKKGGKLPEADIAALVQWVRMGAPDPRVEVAKIAGMKAEDAKTWWAFQPLTLTPTPNPGAALEALVTGPGAAPATPLPMADRRVMLRRITYDLTGLPPTPAEVDAFVSDTSLGAYAKVVERLLASAAYGEKWGRNWLDVVRYADTAGETADMPLPNAWRYRNWVIDAFNRDLPYDEFVREQLAGDLLAAKGPPEQANDKIVATGFFALARRFGFQIEKDVHLTFEDAIDTTGKAFLGLTLGCARCHDHKYDPVTTRDYYALYGILQSSRFTYTGCEKEQMPRDLVPIPSAETKRATAAWEVEMAALDVQTKAADAALAEQAKVFETSVPSALSAGEIAPTGAQDFIVGTAELPRVLTMKKGEMLQLSILPRASHGADSTNVEWVITESGGAARVWNVTNDFLADPGANGGGMPHADAYGNAAVWHLFDMVPSARLMTEFIPNAENAPGLMEWRGREACPALFVNTKTEVLKFLTITMPPRSIALHPGPAGGVGLAWECPADVSVTVRGKVAKIDPSGDGIAWKLEHRPGIGSALAAQKPLVQQLAATKTAQAAGDARKPVIEQAFAVIDATPVNARIQTNGEPKELGDEVPRGMLTVFGGEPVPAHAGSGRLELAECFTRGTARDLTARVMANRIWAGHFGTGIVATPNDFGSRGAPPSNKALLDFLASQFIQSGWSVKAMHRLIVQSAAYQRRDFPRRRLTAEEMRDTLLAVSGTLDRTPVGPHPFPAETTWAFSQHGPFKAVYDNNRRSVYQMVQRQQRHPFLALFDGADPNSSTPMRGQSTVPTQALYFLNDPFVHAQAKAMATRLAKAAPDNAARLELATRELYGRAATEEEKSLSATFLADTSANVPSLSEPERTAEIWAAWLRVLFGTNELLYVD